MKKSFKILSKMKLILIFYTRKKRGVEREIFEFHCKTFHLPHTRLCKLNVIIIWMNSNHLIFSDCILSAWIRSKSYQRIKFMLAASSSSFFGYVNIVELITPSLKGILSGGLVANLHKLITQHFCYNRYNWDKPKKRKQEKTVDSSWYD